MKCVKCGNELGENYMFCPKCGAPAKRVNEEVNNQNTYTYDRPVNQQVNYGEQSNNYRQANNYGQQYAKTKNTNNTVIICIIIIIVAIILAGSFVIGRTVMKNNNETINNGNLSNDYSTTTSDTSTNGGGTSTSTVSTSKSNAYKVKYKGFKFYIPETLIYEMDYANDAINIGDAGATWIVNFGILQGNYQQLKKNKNDLGSYLMQEFSGAIVSKVEVATIGGVEYVLIECSMAGSNVLIGYAGLNAMYSLYFEVFSENNDFDRKPVEYLSSIISSAEYIGESTYMKVNEDAKITGIDKVLYKVLEAKNEDEE